LFCAEANGHSTSEGGPDANATSGVLLLVNHLREGGAGLNKCTVLLNFCTALLHTMGDSPTAISMRAELWGARRRRRAPVFHNRSFVAKRVTHPLGQGCTRPSPVGGSVYLSGQTQTPRMGHRMLATFAGNLRVSAGSRDLLHPVIRDVEVLGKQERSRNIAIVQLGPARDRPGGLPGTPHHRPLLDGRGIRAFGW